MRLFERQIQFLESLESDIYREIENSVNQFGYVLEEDISQKQLFEQGVDGKGKKLLGYSRTTIRIKIAKGQPVDRTTLRDKNDFHPSITIKAFSDRFEVSSSVTHAKFLIKRYGKDILRPSAENINSFMFKYVLPNLKKKINDKFTR